VLSALGYEPEPPTSNEGGLALWRLEWREPVPVTELNTEYVDYTPFLSFDGLALYFSRAFTSSFYYARTFKATREEPVGPFTSVNEVLSSSYEHILSPWVSPDNLRMYYFAQRESPARWQLKFSERALVNDPWPQGTSISELNQLGKLEMPRLTADELIILFDSYNIPGGHGGYDIWMATRPDRNSPFDEVRNLSEINTASNEGGAFVSPDGLELYFQSNRNGPSQIFRATRASLSEPFGNVEHLSFFDTPGGNSGHPCISSDGTVFYFVRSIDGQPCDIYVSYLIENPYELAIIRTEDAISKKVEVLEGISAELEKEWAAYETLEELLEGGDYGDLYKGDIVTAKQKIHSATQHEEQSIDALEKSVEKLKDALSALGYEPAGQAINPNPADGATGVDRNTDLSWTAGSNAVSHDVYFGTTSPPPFISNQTDTTFDPGTMAEDTTYYWRIDEVNPSWTTTGTVWTFTTGGGGWPPV